MTWDLFAWGTGWGDELVRGLLVTVTMALLAYLLGTALGLLAALGELSRFKWLARFLVGYGVVMRALPELLVIFLFYYGGTFLVLALVRALGFSGGVDVDAFTAGVVSLALIQAAYSSEIFRGAILAVGGGPMDAGRALGLNAFQLARLVVVPIALRFAFPGLMNLWMVVIKNTPFVSAIGLRDLVQTAGTAGENTKHYFVFYGAVLLTYLVISGLSMLVQARISKRLYLFRTGLAA